MANPERSPRLDRGLFLAPELRDQVHEVAWKKSKF